MSDVSKAGKKCAKILIVDDEKDIRRLVCAMLDTDFTVIEAENGESAIRTARREQPDLILMDIMMPRVDGYTACKAIKSSPATQAIPVVMLTAIDHELNVRLGRDMGAEGYVTKPFSEQGLRGTIARLLKDVG